MTSQQGLNNLATIIKRLEAATARLEDVAHHSSTSQTPSHNTASSASTGVAAMPSQSSSNTASAPPEVAESPAQKAYQSDVIDGALQDYVTKSKEIGGPVSEHASLIASLCTAQLAHVATASSCTKPKSQEVTIKLLSPIQDALKEVTDFKDKASRGKEGRQWANHLSTVGEGASAWGWVAVEPTPAPFVGEMKDSAQFWANRVIKEFKETDKKHVVWANSFVALIDSLQKYVKQYHTTGLTWNPKGQDPSTFQSSNTADSNAGAPPPPPPGPPPPPFDSSKESAPASAPAGPGAFLSQINQGAGVTSKLKKVDPSQQTHKNPELRAGSVVSEKAAPAPPTKPKPSTLTQKRPAETRLDGTKWIVEYHENAKHVLIEDTEINHTVHLFGCKNSVIEIKGKVNAISAVNCSKTSILLGSVVSGLSITSSPSFTIQILGQVPTIQIDNTDSGQVYLSKECVDTVEIITSKTSAINISLPGVEEGDYEEKPIPEQMKSVIQGGKVVTTIVEHSG